MHHAPDLNVRHLRAIVSLARFGNFVAAANYLQISQPGLTRIIQQAERLLGAQLFLRGTRAVTLTEAGREFVLVAERILIDLDEQSKRVRAIDGDVRGQLVISALMSIAYQVLPSILVECRKRHPNLLVRVREGFGPKVAEDVRSGIVDVGIGNASSGSQDVVAYNVRDERLYVAMPASHALATRKTIKISDLSGEKLVSMPIDSGLRQTVDLAATNSRVQLDHAVITDQFGTLLRFVASGLGVGIIPATVRPPITDQQIRIVGLQPKVNRQIGLLRRRSRPPSDAVELLSELFMPVFEKMTQPTAWRSSANRRK